MIVAVITILIIILVVICVAIIVLQYTNNTQSCTDTDLIDYPIDALITWVDSTDITWIAQKQKYMTAENEDNVHRWNSNLKDKEIEIRTCMKCILKYMPWINKIHLLTCYPQKPACLETDPVLQEAVKDYRIVIVHHDEIFHNPNHLPTFNSEAIEANLHNLNSLSEHFLYFNDDTFVTNHVRPNMFFKQGKAIIHGGRKN